MRVSRLTIENFRGIKKAELHFSGHTLLIGGNNVGKSTVCEALDLVLGPDRLNRTPAVEEFDFHNANYLGDDGTPIPIRIEVVLTNLSPETLLLFGADHVEFWKDAERRVLGVGEIEETDKAGAEFCLRLVTVAKYDSDEDQFTARTIYATDEATEDPRGISNRIKRSIGFLYLRALRTGSRALSLERGSLLDIILRMKEVRTGLTASNRLLTQCRQGRPQGRTGADLGSPQGMSRGPKFPPSTYSADGKYAPL
jgi:putative ATP-dependent endonuclease of OLD family